MQRRSLGPCCPIVILLISSYGFAQEQSKGDQTTGAKHDVAVPVPDLADIIPKAAKLSGELAILQNRVRNVLDVSEFVKKYARIEDNLKGPAAQLHQIKDSKNIRLKKLVELRKVIERENELFAEISRPLSEAIRQFGAWRNDWQTEKQRWKEWQPILLEDGDFVQLKSTFEKAKDSKRWGFLAARPFSAGLFFSSIMLMLFYEYQRVQDASVIGIAIVGGISFARLIGGMNPESWKRQFV